MEKEKLKNNKGITLISLVITIILLIILSVVSINLVMNMGIIQKTEYSTNKYKEAQIREQVELYALEYRIRTGHVITEDAKKIMVDTVLETNLPVDRFILYCDWGAIRENETNLAEGITEVAPVEYIFYNWNTATVAEIKILEKRNLEDSQPENPLVCDRSNRALVWDLNGDGYVEGVQNPGSGYKGDLNEDGYIDDTEQGKFIYYSRTVDSKGIAEYSENNLPYTLEKQNCYAELLGYSINEGDENYLNSIAYSPVLFVMRPVRGWDNGHISRIARVADKNAIIRRLNDTLIGYYEYYTKER